LLFSLRGERTGPANYQSYGQMFAISRHVSWLEVRFEQVRAISTSR